MIVDVVPPGKASVSKSDIADKLSKMYGVKDTATIVPYGFRIAFGGGRSTGFALVYDDQEALKKFEPTFRLKRSGMVPPSPPTGAKQRKERKNRAKKLRGTAKTKPATSKKSE